MVITVQDVCQRALRLCGQIQAPGRVSGTNHEPEVLAFLNQMLDGWNAVRGSIYTIAINRYALTPSQTTFFIGPTGDLQTPPGFNAPRPIKILHANLVLTSNSPEPHLSLHLFSDDEWSRTIITEMPTGVPTALYNDGASPDSKLYLWGFPIVANDLELFTQQALPTALTILDTQPIPQLVQLVMPEGYPRAIVYNLALEIAPLYWKKANPMLRNIERIAQKARADISNANQDTPALVNDAAFIGNTAGGGWNYYSYLTGGLG